MNERIKQLRAELNLSQRQLAKYLGITNTAVSKIETGENKLSEQNIIIICTAFNINEEWMRTGEGEMFNTIKTTPDSTAINYRERIIGAFSVMPLADLIDIWEYIIKKD